MGDTDILVDFDTMDQKPEGKVSDNSEIEDLRDSADQTKIPDAQGHQKLEKVIMLPEGNAFQFKSVKIEVEKSESTDGVSTGWYVLSVMAATCCILPFTLIRDHWKKSRANNLRMTAATCCILPFTLIRDHSVKIRDHWKKSRANNLRMKKGYRMTILSLCMGVIILTIFGLLVLGIVRYADQGSLTDYTDWYYTDNQQGLNQISDQLSTNKKETVKTNKMLINILRQLNDVRRITPAYNRYDHDNNWW